MRRHEEIGSSGLEVDRARREVQRAEPLLRLQRTAGNAAVSSLLAGERGGGPVVQRASATMVLGGWNTKAPPDARYIIKLKAMTTDIVGHAWISVAQLYEPYKHVSFGFWPADSVAGVVLGAVAAGPSALKCPDPHEGEETHSESATIEHDAFLKLLDTVNDWDGGNRSYSLTENNCSTFAGEVWERATGRGLDLSGLVGGATHFWSPAMLGKDIDKDNLARGMDPMDRPLPDAER